MTFEVLEIPGAGAHAAVCLARERDTGRRVCLKVLRTAYDPHSTEAKRVRDEARILARLDHPGIVKLYEARQVDGRDVLVMEWVDGPPVGRLVRRLGRLPHGVALDIARQVAVAVDYAYHLPGDDGRPLRLIHRDLNPSNVLFDVEGRVRVLDYGLARGDFDEREADTAVALLGTQGFTAPEGLVRVPDNPKLDVYSLGVTLFLLLTGHLPVLSKQRVAHAAALAENLAHLRARLAAEGIDADPIDAVIRAMCAFRPEDRPAMSEVARSLAALVPPDTDPRAFAQEVVAPAHAARPRTAPREHAAWPELAFLDPDPVVDAAVPPEGTPGPAAPDPAGIARELRRFSAPWWQVFRRRPSVDRAVALLDALAGPVPPDIAAICRRLALHPDPRVATRARAIAERVQQADEAPRTV